jgi:hypothetical protein
MGKRLSANAPKPRSRFPFPGYPTVAAAGLYLCLSPGCTPQSGVTDPGSTTATETSTTVEPGGAAPIPYPPEPPSAGAPDASPPNEGGVVAPPYQSQPADAGVPDTKVPASPGFAPQTFDADISVPDADPPLATTPDASVPDAESTVPDPAGDIAPPY